MISKFNKFSKAYIHHRYRNLFYSLLLTFAAAPMLAALNLSSHLLQVFLAMNLLAALLSDQELRRSKLYAVSLVCLLVGLALAWIFKFRLLTLAVLPLLGILALATVVNTVRSALRSDKITDETLFAALSGYLLAGLCMAFIYWTVEQLVPGSFVIADTLRHKTLSIAMAVYFSFVTLATVGYGDIVPGGDLARGLVVFECIAGQLYLVVMVARLVSLYRRSS